MADIELTCKQCGSKFTVSEYYRGLLLRLGTNELPSSCPKCSKIHLDAVRAEEAKQERDQEITDTRKRWRLSCGMTALQIGCTFDNFDQEFDNGKHKKDWKICRDYADKFPFSYPSAYRSLFLFSTRTWGTGKTHLASAIANHILDRWDGASTWRCPVYFITEPELFRRIRATYNYIDEERRVKPSEELIINLCIQTPLLLLDDLGKEQVKDPDFVQRTLFAIIDGRYKRKLPVVVTSNIEPSADLKEHLGSTNENDASWNRLWEMCGGKWVNMEGQSYRTQRR